MKTKRNVKSRSLVRTHTHSLTHTHVERMHKIAANKTWDQDKYSQQSHAENGELRE